MKPKHFSLASLVLVVAAVGAVLWFEISQVRDGRSGSGFGPITPLEDIPVPSKAVLARMDRIERSMPMLAAPAPQLRSQADLSAFGYREVSPAGIEHPAGSASEALSATHRLTLAFEGHAKRFCVIDGRLYREGAALPDGATILKIESRRVLIAKKSIRQWLVVDPYLQDAASEKS